MEGKLEYAKFGKVGSNNRVSFFHSNILQRARQWAHFHMKRHWGVTLPGTLFTYARVVDLPESDMNYSHDIHQ